MTTLAICFFFVLFLLIALFFNYRARRYNGVAYLKPWGIFSGNTREVMKNQERIHDFMHEKGVEMGKPYLLGFFFLRSGYLSLPGNPDEIKHVMHDNFKNYILPNDRQLLFKELMGHGIFASNGMAWKVQRKAASHIFTQRLLRQYMSDVVVRHSQIVIDLLNNAIKAGGSIDLQTIYFKFTMDAFTEFAFGESTDSLLKENVPFAKAIDEVQYLVLKRMFNPFWQISKFFSLSKDEKLIKHYVKIINTYAKEVISRRKGDEMKSLVRQDLISHYIRAMKEKKQEISDEQMRDVIVNFILAGRDTTAVALSWFSYELTQHPKVEEKVLAEILRAKQTCTETGFELANMLQYTEMALLESLRLHPPVPGDDREALNDDKLPDGTLVKKGIHVCFDPYVTNRSTKIWGSDALEYKPERWWDENEQKIRNVSAYEFPTFSAGPRLCLGKSLAISETKVLIAELLPLFKFTLVNKNDIMYKVSMTLPMKNGLFVKVEHRK